jgi:hypothetical protein
MGRKRFSYLTDDGKRHWIALAWIPVPASIEFVPAEIHDACRNDNRSPWAMGEQMNSGPVTVLAPLHTDAGMTDK